MKKVYIIPGFNESHLKQKGYDKIGSFFRKQGIKPIQVSIRWRLKQPIDFEKYNKQFLKIYTKEKKSEVYILGFSYGAVIAFLTESRTKPTGLILCSLSPYFVEDYQNLKPAWLKWWKKNFINDINFSKAGKNISSKTYLVAGDKEPNSVMIRAKIAKRKLRKSQLIVAKGAKHNVSQKEYLNTLEKLIGSL
jgi:alpha/beta superfamily hydrolase